MSKSFMNRYAGFQTRQRKKKKKTYLKKNKKKGQMRVLVPEGVIFVCFGTRSLTFTVPFYRTV